jgi:hypothetical protein
LNRDPAAGDQDRARSLEDPLRKPVTLLTAAIGLAMAVPADAADTFYLCTWKFDSAIVAPWADPHDKPDVA